MNQPPWESRAFGAQPLGAWGNPGAAATLLLDNALHSAWRRVRHWQGSIQLLAAMQESHQICGRDHHFHSFSHDFPIFLYHFPIKIVEGSLEVKLPTIWTDGKAEVGRVKGKSQGGEAKK